MAIKSESLVDLFKAGAKVKVWVAPYGEAVPADSVGIGTAWGGNWESLGWTEAGVKLIHAQSKAQAKIQQATMAVTSAITEETLRGETVLSLSDPSRVAVILGRASTAATDTAAGAGQVGKTELTLAATVTRGQKWALGVESNQFDANGAELPRRIFFPRVELMPNGDLMTFDTQSDAFSGLPVAWDAFADVANSMNYMTYQNVTAPAAS